MGTRNPVCQFHETQSQQGCRNNHERAECCWRMKGPLRRGVKRPGKYSLSCTDEDWERIRAHAWQAGMTVSAFIVQ